MKYTFETLCGCKKEIELGPEAYVAEYWRLPLRTLDAYGKRLKMNKKDFRKSHFVTRLFKRVDSITFMEVAE